jgi:hypothetical protein
MLAVLNRGICILAQDDIAGQILVRRRRHRPLANRRLAQVDQLRAADLGLLLVAVVMADDECPLNTSWILWP